MNTNELSLADLRDIVLPEPVAYWPPAPGWWLFIAMLCALILFTVLRASAKWRTNAYRRAALRETRDAQTATELAEILRRTAIVAHGREEVIGLSGEVWSVWLERTGNCPMTAAARAALDGVYSGEPIDPKPLRAYAETWIKEHAC